MERNNEVKRNIPILYFYSVLVKRVTMPIIVLYYLFFNLTFSQIGIIASVLAISTLLLEVPSGIFADKYGRKKALLVCSTGGALSMFLYFIGNDFRTFAIAAALFGISISFVSGTKSSMLYDTLINLKKQKLYKKYSGRTLFYSHFLNGLILLAIPFIYQINVKLPFAIGTGFYVTSFILATFLIEPPLKKKIGRGFANVFSDSGKEIMNKKGLILIMIISSLSLAFIYATSEYYQPLMTLAEFPVALFGFIYFGKRIFLGIGAELSHRLEKMLKPVSFLVLIGILIILAYLGSTLNILILVLGAIILFSFVEGIIKVVLGDEVNKRVSSDNRSTIVSLESFIKQTSLAILAIFYGYFADIIGIQQMLLIGAALFSVVFITIFSLIVRKKVL